MSEWVQARLSSRHDWAEGLMTIRLNEFKPQFTAGQFFNLGLELGERRIRRAYSAASAPGEAAEFVISKVVGGELTPMLFELQVGGSLWVQQSPAGFFTLDFVPSGVRDLWLIATGTGIGPYVSMLRDGLLSAYERVIVVHGVRFVSHLTYSGEFIAFMQAHTGSAYVPVVTGKANTDHSFLSERIPTLLESGALEHAAGAKLTPENSHVLLCGNPDMIREGIAVLERRGLKRNRRREPGHITMEKYW